MREKDYQPPLRTFPRTKYKNPRPAWVLFLKSGVLTLSQKIFMPELK